MSLGSGFQGLFEDGSSAYQENNSHHQRIKRLGVEDVATIVCHLHSSLLFLCSLHNNQRDEIFPQVLDPEQPTAFLSGPSFAKELLERQV